jgi:small subunit ribosomal protein S10
MSEEEKTKKTTPKKAASKKTTAKKEKVATKKASIAKTKTTADKKKSEKADAPAPSIRIKLSAFDHVVLDEAAEKIIDTATRSGAVVQGPIPLPTKIKKFTVNRSTFVYKTARDQYEMRTHRRLIDLKETTFKTVESLQNLALPSGVDIEIKMG